MTNITKLYQQLQEGKTTREYFVREARRQFPQFISPVTSFTDAVNILKSKRLVSENITKEVSGAFFDAPPVTTIDEATLKDLVQPLVAKLESMGFETEIDPYGGYKTLFAWKTFPNGNTLTMFVGPSDYELKKRDYKGFDEFSTIDVSFKYYTTEITKKLFGLYKSKKRVLQALPDEGGREIDLGVGMFDIPIEDSVERIASLVRKAEQKVESGQLNKSEPVNEAHKLDAEQILDRMSPYAVKKGMEAELKKEKTYDNTTIDKVKEKVARKLKKNPNAYDDQIVANVKKVEKQDKELEATELKKELVDKKNAMRKPKGFKADKANTKASKKENRKGKPKGVKVMPDKGVIGTEKVIKENIEDDEYMKPRPGGPLLSPQDKEAEDFDLMKMKVKGWYRKNFANPKSQLASKWDNEFYGSVEAASNKEELKQAVQSILMGDTSSARKELGLDENKTAVIENLKQWLQENVSREYHPGMEVKTPDGQGIVKEVIGGTLTVELEDSNIKDYQFNVINKLMDKDEEEPIQTTDEPIQVDPDKAARDAAFAKLPNLGSVRGSGNVIPRSWWQDMTKEEKIAAIIERLNKMEEGENKEKIKEMIKSKLKEGGAAVAISTNRGEKIIPVKSAGDATNMANDLRKSGFSNPQIIQGK